MKLLVTDIDETLSRGMNATAEGGRSLWAPSAERVENHARNRQDSCHDPLPYPRDGF